jgi:hypothetical protein
LLSPLLPSFPPTQYLFTVHTDEINMQESSSVEHS